MQLDKRQIRRSFSRAAATYDQAAVLQRRMLDETIQRLDLVQLEPRTVVDLGCGTGYGVAGLNHRYPDAQIIALDLAESMLRYARAQSHGNSRPDWICGDAEHLPLADNSVDLIVCSATLQWCELEQVFRECARVLRNKGVFAFTSFGPDTLLEVRQAWRQVDDRVHVHDFIDMHDIGDALLHAGFSDPVLDVERVQLTYADTRQALNEVRRLGSTNAAIDRRRGLLGKQRFQALQQALVDLRTADGRLPVTYECIYGHAFAAPHPRQTRLPDGSVAVPIDHALK